MNKHSVTLPDGTTATRNSEGRIYTHCVVYFTTAEERDAGRIASLDYARRYVARLEAELADPTHSQHSVAAGNLVIARRHLAEAEARTPITEGDWSVEGWQSRRDLADKLASRLTGRRHSVRVLEVTLR